MSDPRFHLHPETPFPVGVEYYRAPIPKQEVWDADFAAIRAAGMRVVRSFSFWNHMEPAPGRYELEDFDLMFDLAEKHGLHVWLDVTLATHGSCPEWLLREHPDIRAVDRHGNPLMVSGSAAAPQGAILHCYDHPAWEEFGGALLRHVVHRYKDRSNLLVWGLWDGVAPVRAGLEPYPCYCEHSLAAYKRWLRARYSLEELNRRLLRRYRTWDDVAAPRDNQNVVEMLMFRRFTRDNLVGKAEVDGRRDPGHRPPPRGARPQRRHPAALERGLRRRGRQLGHVDVVEQPADLLRPVPDRLPSLRLRRRPRPGPERTLVERGDLRRHGEGRGHLEEAVRAAGADRPALADPGRRCLQAACSGSTARSI